MMVKAASQGDLDEVRALVAGGTGPVPVDRRGGAPPSDAEAGGHAEIAALLRQHAGQPGPGRPGEREAAAG